ncbi:hypothetical protein AB0D59_09135 [Streptomyces sp. NPDC048417]|uniref:hypothetical protein n=1 Tax=Streptomyces sp. NPDC048417 TaxID=3155387 RepID=UPI003447F7B8
MTTEGIEEHLSVYRLLPSMSDFQLLHLDDQVVELMRWQRAGSAGPYPARFTAEWAGDPRWPKSEFPTGDASSPVLSRRIADLLWDDLEKAGRLLPVRIKNADDGYLLYLVERVVDCLDTERSSVPDRIGRIRESVFRADAVPADVPAFRPTAFPTAVCWNGWAARLLSGLLGDQLECRLVWSEDPGPVPHPDPWGF